LILTSTAFITAASSTHAAADDVSYIDENGILNKQNNITVIDDTYFASLPYTLDDLDANGGWYLVRGTFVLNDVVTISGDVRLILENNCNMTVNGTGGNAGINVAGTNSLTIYAQSTGGNAGALTAKGGNSGAGIGGNLNTPCGTITINGGTVVATGGASGDSAGIGGAGTSYLSCKTITINGGTVVATAGGSGAGIGGSVDSPGGTIIINGGDVTAYGTNSGPGIGIGAFFGPTDGTIIITGGTVTAYGGGSAAGIGSGQLSSGGRILIYGENTKVTAVGGAGAPRDIGAGGGMFSSRFELFAMLAYGNLLGAGDAPIGNTVLFTADPHTVVGMVTMSLPAPYNVYGPAGNGTIPLMTGLGPDAFTTPSEKEMSLLTTFTTQTVTFTLEDYSDSPQSRTGTQLTTAGVSVDFHSRSYFEVTVEITGDGSVEVSDGVISYGVVTPSNSGVTFRIPDSVREIFLTATAGTGYTFDKFFVNGNADSANPLSVPIDSDVLATGVFTSSPPIAPIVVTPTYCITATSDVGSKITPEGRISVLQHSSQTFVFSAGEGRAISAVTVDDVPLTQAQISSGSYTFYDVTANHTIDVTSRSEKADLTLKIDVIEGRGKAEYSVDGKPFVVYTGPVALSKLCSLEVRAIADNGYGFVKWTDGTDVYTVPQISFGSVSASVNLELYFEGGNDDGSVWWLLGVFLLLLLAGLLLLLIFRRRYVQVYIDDSAGIEGADRVHKKSPYTFSMRDGYLGAVFYRIGEDGQWKQVLPDANGKYTIPRKETTDDVYLEKH